MTIFEDKLPGTILPTRDGPAQGAGAERVMLNAVGGPDEIRTRIVNDPDGTTTMLRTRNGMPEFTTTTAPEEDASSVRGFATWVAGKATGTLFYPYTLAILKKAYKPVSVPYTVLPFSTTYNVPTSDTTLWNDVIVFDGITVRINGKKMPSLGMAGFVPAAKALPWLIPDASASGISKYGDKAGNEVTKRVFAVGRDQVQSWGGGGITLELVSPPAAPGVTNNVMTTGQRIESATNIARLESVFFYGGTTWNSEDSEWISSISAVTMTLTPPYLLSAVEYRGIDIPVEVFAPVSRSTTVSTHTVAVPDAAVGFGGACVLTNEADMPVHRTSALFQFLKADLVLKPVNVEVSTTITPVSTHSGSTDTYWYVGDMRFTYTASATKHKSSTSVSAAVMGQEFFSGVPIGGTLSPGCRVVCNAGALEIDYAGNSPPLPLFGVDKYTVDRFNVTGSGVTQTTDTQTFDAFFKLDGEILTKVSFVVDRAKGQTETYANDNTPLETFLRASPFYGSGFSGITAGTYDYVGIYGGLYSEINAAVNGAASSYLGSRYCSNAREFLGSPFICRATKAGSAITPIKDSVKLLWKTKDYLLHDIENNVSIAIESAFEGSQDAPASGLAILVVSLTITSGGGVYSRTLSTLFFSYATLLPENTIAAGVSAVLSPQLRAFYAPLYREQGNFKGVSYVTASEEGKGAAPVHLFNFSLYLRTHDNFSSINADNDKQVHVNFIPFGLLELLYCYVFSQDYGIGRTTSKRYPITNPAAYEAVISSLFSAPIEVNVMNGTVGPWAGDLGGNTAELYRV